MARQHPGVHFKSIQAIFERPWHQEANVDPIKASIKQNGRAYKLHY